MKIEICCYNIGSVVVAEKSGADRVELCASPAEGGVTPGPGTIQLARKLISKELFVMIRPRGGDFLYSDDEFETMLHDIDFAKKTGADGVVLGVLNADGAVDIERTKRLAEAAQPMEVTFHRAFDMTPDPFQALEDVISAGAGRILTSGQKPTAMAGAAVIAELVKKAGDRIRIMAGSGIKDSNVLEVTNLTNVNEIHLSAKKHYPSKMRFINHGLSMGGANDDESRVLLADGDLIARIRMLISSKI
jgi:copper homeostasis protein